MQNTVQPLLMLLECYYLECSFLLMMENKIIKSKENKRKKWEIRATTPLY